MSHDVPDRIDAYTISRPLRLQTGHPLWPSNVRRQFLQKEDQRRDQPRKASSRASRASGESDSSGSRPSVGERENVTDLGGGQSLDIAQDEDTEYEECAFTVITSMGSQEHRPAPRSRVMTVQSATLEPTP